MSVSLYQTGVSGLLASQQQLATTGHNIANVNTEGFTRQRAEQNTPSGFQHGSNFLGTGTYIQDITRLYNQFAYKEQLHSKTNLGNADMLHRDLSQLNELMTYAGGSVDSSLNQFYQTMNSIADNPSDLGLRNIALTQAGILASDFNSINDKFSRLEQATNEEIAQIANEMSQISKELAKINEQILEEKGLNINGQPNDLLDQRDRLLTQLGEYTSVNSVVDANGVATVIIGNGATLVAGITPLTVGVRAGDPDPLKTELELVGTSSSVPLNGSYLGGVLEAKFEFRDQHLEATRAEINRLAMAIAVTLNDAQANGLDLNQTQGANLFTDINTLELQQGRALEHNSNAGTLQAQVNITDVSLLPNDDFQIRFDGVNYLMTNMSDQSVTNLGAPGAGTYNTPFGFQFIESSGAPASDDKVTLKLGRNTAALMAVTLTDGSGIAASEAIEITPGDNNVSPGKVTVVDMLDPVNARAAMPMRIDVLENPPGTFTYTYTDNLGATSAPVAYTPPSQQVNLPPAPAATLFTIEITGTPSGLATNAPEQFFIKDSFGLGNGRNALAIGLTQEKQIINGGRESFSENLATAIADVGSNAKSAELVSETATSLFTQAYNRNQQAAGVNLDEEAANLLKFQQAYQASSRIISVATEIFDTLLAAAR